MFRHFYTKYNAQNYVWRVDLRDQEDSEELSGLARTKTALAKSRLKNKQEFVFDREKERLQKQDENQVFFKNDIPTQSKSEKVKKDSKSSSLKKLKDHHLEQKWNIDELKWQRVSEINALPFSSLTKKVINQVFRRLDKK